MNKAKVSIKAFGVGKGSVLVDGVDISSIVTSATAQIEAGESPKVLLSLVAPSMEVLNLSEAGVVVKGVSMPVSVELALYKHLSAKHGALEIDVTALSNTIRSTELKTS